jgi:flagellar biosynthesis chaperone FliJ
MSQVPIKVSEDIYKKVKEIAEKSGKSIREIVEEAINIYLLGKEQAVDKDVKEIKNRWIVAKYPSKCSKCSKQINVGDMVFWVRITYNDNSIRSYIYCSDCYLTSFDTSLAKKYLKIKELEATFKSLKKMCDSLAEQVKQMQDKVNLYNLMKEIEQFWFAFQTTFTQNPDSQIVRDFLNKLEDLIEKVSNLEKAIDVKLTQSENILRRKVRKVNESL